jgi:hypothetical protein
MCLGMFVGSYFEFVATLAAPLAPWVAVPVECVFPVAVRESGGGGGIS